MGGEEERWSLVGRREGFGFGCYGNRGEVDLMVSRGKGKELLGRIRRVKDV